MRPSGAMAMACGSVPPLWPCPACSCWWRGDDAPGDPSRHCPPRPHRRSWPPERRPGRRGARPGLSTAPPYRWRGRWASGCASRGWPRTWSTTSRRSRPPMPARPRPGRPGRCRRDDADRDDADRGRCRPRRCPPRRGWPRQWRRGPPRSERRPEGTADGRGRQSFSASWTSAAARGRPGLDVDAAE